MRERTESKLQAMSEEYLMRENEKNKFEEMNDSIAGTIGYYAVTSLSYVGSAVYSAFEWGAGKVTGARPSSAF